MRPDNTANTTAPPDIQHKKQVASDRNSLNFARRAGSFRRQRGWGMTIGFSGLFLSVASLVIMNKFPGLVPINYIGAVPIGMIAVAAVALPWATMANVWLNRMIEDAKKSQDKRKVGVLLDAFQEYAALAHRYQNDRKRIDVLRLIVADVTQPLKVILPQMEEVDAILFTPAQRKTLRLLLRNRDSATVRSALQALGKIGNGADLPMIQQLANGAWTAAVDPGLAETAQSTSVQILARLAELNSTQTLLRGSAMHEGVPTELLRPAISQPDQTDAEQLLRADQ